VPQGFLKLHPDAKPCQDRPEAARPGFLPRIKLGTVEVEKGNMTLYQSLTLLLVCLVVAFLLRKHLGEDQELTEKGENAADPEWWDKWYGCFLIVPFALLFWIAAIGTVAGGLYSIYTLVILLDRLIHQLFKTT
jgi:ABC-type Fe3+ transport system permease subunit